MQWRCFCIESNTTVQTSESKATTREESKLTRTWHVLKQQKRNVLKNTGMPKVSRQDKQTSERPQ